MLHFHCTAKLAKAARLKLEPAPKQDGLHWLDRWYANVVPLGRKSDVILFTNAESLFTILVPQVPGKVTFFAAVAEFRQKLKRGLVDAGMSAGEIASVEERHAQYITCKTALRSILGSMNDMVLSIAHYKWREEFTGEEINVDNLQAGLNEVPHSPIGYNLPVRRFRELASSIEVPFAQES